MALDDLTLHVFFVFCRVAGALMVMPGFSNARVPLRVRLFVALSLAWMIGPLVQPIAPTGVGDLPVDTVLRLIVQETLIGAMIGFVGRIYLAALAFTGAAIASYVGYGLIPGGVIDDTETAPAISTLITIAAVTLMFIADIHWQFIITLITSYANYPIGRVFEAPAGLDMFTQLMSNAFILGLQLSGPFLVYGLLLNLLFGIVNRLIPQVPAYFVSMPFLVYGGLILLHFTIDEFLILFSQALLREYTNL